VTKLSLFLRGTLKSMFTDYNGIQIFLYPGTLFYWISSSSILLALSTLLSVRVHFLPITFWGVLFIYLAFMIMKIYTMIFSVAPDHQVHLLDEFWDSIINLHARLFVVLLIVMVFFVLSEFLSYFYGIKLPVKHAVMLFFRLFTILLIIAYYIPHMWLKPYRERGYSKRRSEMLCYSWLIKHPLIAIKYSGLLFLILIAAVRLYLLMINYVYSPLLLGILDLTGINVRLELIRIDQLWSVFYNLFILAAAFILSNVCFYPLIVLAQFLADKLHPISFAMVNSEEINQYQA